MLDQWEKSESKFWRILLITAIVAMVPVIYFYSYLGVLFYALGVVSFVVEFRLIVWAVGLLLGTIKANFSAMAIIFFGKLAIWLVLASSPFWLPKGMGSAFAMGAAVFALSLLIFVLTIGGLPRLLKN